ncbi:hypothetical protein NBH14_05110 [Parabacteroides sp. TA-V-105]|nr:hypothetical protein [Parabacteroides segnis]MCM0712066.1 hypothetical protein [Parabacteroides sp. TA-V-105]
MRLTDTGNTPVVTLLTVTCAFEPSLSEDTQASVTLPYMGTGAVSPTAEKVICSISGCRVTWASFPASSSVSLQMM